MIPYHVRRRVLSEELLEQAKAQAERRPNGHLTTCVCRICFEAWREDQAALRREMERPL